MKMRRWPAAVVAALALHGAASCESFDAARTDAGPDASTTEAGSLEEGGETDAGREAADGADGGAPLDAALPDGGLAFDGVDDLVTVPTMLGNILGAGDFTLEARIRIPIESPTVQVILSGRASTSNGFIFGLLSNRIYVQLEGVPNIEAPSSPLLNTDQWFDVAVTRGNGALSFWVDGNAFVANTPMRPALITSSAAVKIGADLLASSYFKGTVRLVRIWNRALEGHELLATRGGVVMPPATPGLVAQWTMTDGMGQAVTDTEGAYHGTLGQSTSAEASDPSWLTP